MPLSVYNGKLLQVGGELATNEDCCCGDSCPTGCECPEATTLPSSVLATITFSDCCGTSRTVSTVLALTSSGLCGACLQCTRYEWLATRTYAPGSSCTSYLCAGITFDFDCDPISGEECFHTEGQLYQVSLAPDSCTYDDGTGQFGQCKLWALRFAFVVKGYQALGYLAGNSSNVCLCDYPSGGCQVTGGCAGGLVTVCKADGQADPRGSYGDCTGDLYFCDEQDAWNCNPSASAVVS